MQALRKIYERNARFDEDQVLIPFDAFFPHPKDPLNLVSNVGISYTFTYINHHAN
jgi:hypothetical protein